MDNFYVYAYLDTRYKGSFVYGEYSFQYKPFYIGKGKGKRYLDHLCENGDNTHNQYKFRTISKIKKETGKPPLIIKLKEELSEEEAYQHEIDIITLIGLSNLTNITNGGSGGDTLSKHPNKEQIYKKISKKVKEAWTNEKRLKHSIRYSGKNNPRYGAEISKELRNKMSKSSMGQKAWNKGLTAENNDIVKQYSDKRRGQKLTRESRNKMSNAKKGVYDGENNPRYIDLTSYEKEIIELRFNLLSVVKIAKVLNKKYNLNISRVPIERILNKYNINGRDLFYKIKTGEIGISDVL